MGIITGFDPWRSKYCSCAEKMSLSAYTGCAHACLYCYATSYIRNFNAPREKTDYLKRLRSHAKRLQPGSTITIANSSDPYQPLEKKLQHTRTTLEILSHEPVNILLVTKSALIVRDVTLLKELKRVVVAISVTCLDEKLARILEPGASTPRARIKALEKLAGHGIPIVARIDPLVYPLNTANLKQLITQLRLCGAKQIITSTYKAKPDSLKRMCAHFPEYKKIWDDLYLAKGELIAGYRYLPGALRKRLTEEVRDIAHDQGLKFSCCREGFQKYNTAACDGASFLLKPQE